MDLINTINRIERKLGLVNDKLVQTQKENVALKEENRSLKHILKERDETVQLLIQKMEEQKEEAIEIGDGKNINKDEIDNLKRKIDQYINSINECIEWLRKN